MHSLLLLCRLVSGPAPEPDDNDDRANSPEVAIVNQEFARRAFGGSAIGKRIRLERDSGGWAEIVGITAAGKYNGITEPPSRISICLSVKTPCPE